MKLLCDNFLNRKLLKATNIDYLTTEVQLEALVITRSLTEKLGKDPSFYCGLRHNKFIGYQPYKSGLRIWDGSELKAIENSSSLIDRLISPSKTAWLIYPKEIHIDLSHKLFKLRESQKYN